MNPSREITLKIRCYNLPGVSVAERKAVRLGIQKRQEVVDDVAADVNEAIFLAPLRIELSPTGVANFLGPFAHGTPKERFVYLCWGERKQGIWYGFSRAKLQLLPIPHALLMRALNESIPLEVHINMTDEKGKLICATIKEKQLLFDI